MRNAISLLKHYIQNGGVSRTLPPGSRPSRARATDGRISCAWAVVAAVILMGTVAVILPGTGVSAQAPASQRPESQAVNPVLPGRRDPGLANILLPRHAPAGSYQLSVLDVSIEAARSQLMAALAPEGRVDDPPGAWKVRPTEPLEAFGDAGLYNRSRLARLYAGKRALVLHAPITRGGRVAASLTLISPHPDAALERLSPGTVAILFVVDAARRPPSAHGAGGR